MLTTRRQSLRVAQPSRMVEVGTTGVSLLLTSNPTSFYYKLPRGDDAKALSNLLISTQKRHYGTSALEVHFSNNQHLLIRQAKLMIDKYPIDKIKRGIHFACWLSDYPYSFAFVEKCIGYLETYYGL